ncbi:hypothetical protein FIBSPDRAFT_856704 [Athelia psychrophila]|uniref:Zona occludens toxin N-terminal domain-containing protein n=1 Tax=Athelia psychrophila TaxID=1759441 RepID=A0A166N0C5_9AGAM|nr:hypothetical protein FIBSPDRAFT_856704 [Fibularhizoctonia sp. CBS 109695]
MAKSKSAKMKVAEDAWVAIAQAQSQGKPPVPKAKVVKPTSPQIKSSPNAPAASSQKTTPMSSKKQAAPAAGPSSKQPENAPTLPTAQTKKQKKQKPKPAQFQSTQPKAQVVNPKVHLQVDHPLPVPTLPVQRQQPVHQLSAPPGLAGPNVTASASSPTFTAPLPVPRLPSPPVSSSSPSLDEAVRISTGNEEIQLLEDDSLSARGRSRDHELRTAPIFTRNAYVALGAAGHTTQYGVLGKVIEICSGTETETPEEMLRMYVNTNAPFSAIVCGVQGSGKSHTVSVLLENMFIPSCTPIGALAKPLCGLVLHFGEGGPASRPCEAAWVGVPSFQGVRTPPVRVFVSRSSLNTMRAVYAPLGSGVVVEPLLFSEAELDAEAFLSMMSVSGSDGAPLYIQIILSILRDLGENYTYRAFILQLEEHKKNFNPAQLAGLEQRMALLQSFMDKGKGTPPHSRFEPGQLTIIDLSDPFIDPASACGLFEIVTRLFVRADVNTGKVLLVDEAHKYLSTSKGTTGLTKALLTLTRQQRHLAMRILISTQEPTVVPAVLLDLCTVAILHRFQSPSWWKHLAEHVSADVSAEDAFEKVVGLQTGEAIILAPSGLQVKDGLLRQLGRRYCCVKMRKRVTADGGASILVLE